MRYTSKVFLACQTALHEPVTGVQFPRKDLIPSPEAMGFHGKVRSSHWGTRPSMQDTESQSVTEEDHRCLLPRPMHLDNIEFPLPDGAINFPGQICII